MTFDDEKLATDLMTKTALPLLATQQRTLADVVTCEGIGVHSGRPVTLRLCPAPVNTGIIFRRTDIEGSSELRNIKAIFSNVTETKLCTTIANDAGTSVATIEHLMAALAGLGIDNAYVDINAAELPIMDGSSEPFVFMIECAGILLQTLPRPIIQILKSITVEDGKAKATLSPAKAFSIDCKIDFESGAIGKQACSFQLVPGAFKAVLSRARTFGLLQEVEHLRSMGLARGGSLDNAIVIDRDKVVNPEGLRFADEFARHKTLDALGDLYLAGAQILGHYEGVRPSHALNNRLLRALFADPSAFRQIGPSAATTLKTVDHLSQGNAADSLAYSPAAS